jgi:anti-sigma factor RsiW
MNDQINPNHEIDGEILSAYLDDELTTSERAVVKQALENSPQLRESLQELKIISDEIQCLAVEFHPNEQQLLETVITKIRDRNLSVHGQAPYSNVKIPAMARGWKQRLQIPALLALTAGVLAVLTLQFMPNDQSMTLVQTEMADESPSVESYDRVENNAELESAAGDSPATEGAGAQMGGMGGGGGALADNRALQESQKHRDNANNLTAGQLADAAVDPAAPARTRASSFPIPRALAVSEETLGLDKPADDKTDVADVTYHIQVKQKDLPALLALITAHQNLVQNIQRKKVVGLSGGEKNLAETSKQRVSLSEPAENKVRKSTVNQIVMFRSNASQLAVLVAVLQKNPAATLSMNHLQRSALGNRLMAKDNDTSANVKNQNTTTIMSDTIFSIQVIAIP